MTGGLTFLNGKRATVALVGPAENPKGAMVIPSPVSGQSSAAQPLVDFMDLLSPAQMIDILCAQERLFGKCGLEPLELGP